MIEPQEEGNPRVLAEVREGLEEARNGKVLTFSSIQEFDEKMKKIWKTKTNGCRGY